MKYNVLLKFFVVLIIVVQIVDGENNHRRNRKKHHKRIRNPKNDFDLLIFTQHWPQSVCYAWKEKYPSHTCFIPSDDEWTIHGIWPSQLGKEAPSYCNNATQFDPNLLLPIKDELEIKWIDIENGTTHYSFWQHEWEKHGTCGIILEPINDEYKYFNKGLKLLDSYDMKHVLANANIFPNNSYRVQEILDGVKNVLGKTCQVQCIVNSKTKDHYLFEIRICFDKSFNLINCDGIADYPTNCTHKRNILYLSSVPDDVSVVKI